MNSQRNSSPVYRLRLGRTALISPVIPIAQMHAQTQAEMNAVARSDFARADADLNKTYQSVLAKLRDTETRQKLRKAQRVWVASRDAEAARRLRTPKAVR
jgi:uncharacterized protein YecT (DUF1311 family)